MDKQNKKKHSIKKRLYAVLGTALAVFAVLCTGVRVHEFSYASHQTALAAAIFSMSNGTFKLVENAPQDTTQNSQQEVTAQPQTQPPTVPATAPVREGVKKLPIKETQYGAGGEQYRNFFVKNKTNFNLNVGQELKEPLGFKIDKNSNEPQVLIMHTHTCESFIEYDEGFYYEDFYPRTTDVSKSIAKVGDSIVASLKKAGIAAIADKTIHDSPSYTGSYDRSYETIENYIKKYPSIKVVLDIHRDSISDDNSTKMKPTFVYNGQKGAQIMILSGYDEDGSYDFPDWNYNLRFALRLQQTAETMFPGISRPLDFGDYVYNENINTGSLLIEIGADSNTLAEAEYTGQLLGEALGKVLTSG
ncbi:MAG: stage II sporulation protein P [Oscillospiraceae bacterium]|jgi:stage II sporulation protein P|nr:stage II sporulation protein P [Oscillospiraceae bacterium]